MDQGTAKSSKEPDKKDGQHRGFRKFGRYLDGVLVGQGGMGAVYKAKDEHLGRIVAIKILPPDKAKNAILVKRFQSEAKAAAQLDHQNIVRVFDSGEVDGHLYIAMEFIEGIDGAELVAQVGPLDPERSLNIIKQVVAALGHAFERRIVHRDIKPSNLIVQKKDHVKLADMGLARSIDEEESAGITRAGTTVGTVDFMSPEQGRNSKDADFRSDVYSLGATWYYLLTGEPPFATGDLLNKLNAHAHAARPDPREKNPEIPPRMVDVMHQMMAIDPEGRYRTPDELLADLERVNTQEREISYDLIASLGDEDDVAPAKKSTRGGGLEEEPTHILQRAVRPKRPEAPEAKRGARTSAPESKPAPEAKADRTAKRGRTTKPEEDTRAERSSKTSSVPVSKATDESPQLERRRHRQLNVEFDQQQMTKYAVGGVLFVVVAMIAWSAIKQATSQPVPVTPSSLQQSFETSPNDALNRGNRPKKIGE